MMKSRLVRLKQIGSKCSPLLWALLQLVGCISPPNLSVPDQADFIVAGVTVINPGTSRILDQSIVIRDGLIRDVRPWLETDPEPLCVDCYAVPGLIDAHVHNPPRIAIGNQELFALMYLAHGITTVRDVGASEDSIEDLANRLNNGELVGPRMMRCGPVLDGEPPGWPVAVAIADRQAGIDAVDRLSEEGVDCIKVYNELSPEAFAGIAAAARRHGLPLVGHVPHAVGLTGVEDFEAQHFTGVPYLSRPRPPFGWDTRDEDIISLTHENIEHALDIAVRQRVSFTPTLANFSLRLIASDSVRFTPPAASQFLPPYWVDAWDLIAGHPSTEEAIEGRLAAVPVMRALVREANDRGIDVLAGTDTLMPWVVPGDALHLEIEELRESLGSSEAALAAATTVNGRHIAPGEIGRIAIGARADILLVADDPIIDLRILREWKILIADGRRYDREIVDGWLDEYRIYFHGWYQTNVIGTIVGWAAGLFAHH